MSSVVAYGCSKAGAPLCPMIIERREVGPLDVQVDILYAGICHSDIHQAKGEWQGLAFPAVPGHEIVGRVQKIGENVTKVKVGDVVGVGSFVQSCRSCNACHNDNEQHCSKGVLTSNGRNEDGTPTYGGYSQSIVVTEHFVLSIPPALQTNLSAAAPLLCAGITAWTPMKGFQQSGAPRKANEKKRVGIIGLGGIGHMAVKFGVAFGNHVTVISSSDKKRRLALETLKADAYINSSDAKQMEDACNTFDCLLDTVSVPKDMKTYLVLLKPLGSLVTVGLPASGYNMHIDPALIIPWSKTIAGSAVAGIKATQEMLDFCASHNIVPMVEVITADKINEAYKRVLKNDVNFRFSIDIKNSNMTIRDAEASSTQDTDVAVAED